MKTISFLLGFVMITSCSSASKNDAAAASAAAGGVTEAYSISNGICTQMIFSAPTGVHGDLKAGECPSTVTVDKKSAKIVKTCSQFADSSATKYTIIVYDKMMSDTNEVQSVDDEAATAICSSMKEAIMAGG